MSKPVQDSRPYRIVLTGAESTGKTTLAEFIAERFGLPLVSEYVRTFVEQSGTDPVIGDLPSIADGFLSNLGAATRGAPRAIVLDTDLVSTVIYSKHFLGFCPPALEELAIANHGDLYLLAKDDIPWEADPGQRACEETRALLQPVFESYLIGNSLNYVIIAGDSSARERRVLEVLTAMLE